METDLCGDVHFAASPAHLCDAVDRFSSNGLAGGVLARVRGRICAVTVAVASLVLGALPAGVTAQVKLKGRVSTADTHQPVPDADVRILGTSSTARSRADGTYEIANSPVGRYQVEARHADFGRSAAMDVRLSENATTVILDLSLSRALPRLFELGSAGTALPLAGTQTPFAADKISADAMPIPSTASPLEMLAGKAAGLSAVRDDGSPGAGMFVQFRNRGLPSDSTVPVIIVDGVLLSNENDLTTQDLEGLDIDNIQLLKGPAATAYYGLRGIAGAIVISTKRGSTVPVGGVQFMLRNEIGRDLHHDYFDKLTAHAYRVNASGQYVNASGLVVPRSQRVAQTSRIVENPYIDPTYDHAAQVFRAGLFNSQTATLMNNRSSGNFNLSYTRNQQQGIIPETRGYQRQTFRLNGDQYFANRVRVGLSLAHTLGDEEPFLGSFTSLMFLPADLNLRAPEPTGAAPFVIFPDKDFISSGMNPLAAQALHSGRTSRTRTLASVNASVRATPWLSFDIAGSYDRALRSDTLANRTFGFDGVLANNRFVRLSRDTGSLGWLQGGASLSNRFGELETYLAVRGETQRELHAHHEETYRATLNDFAPAPGSPRGSMSSQAESRVKAGLGQLLLDYDSRYIADLVYRNEDFSRFGSGGIGLVSTRAAFAWIMTNESWFAPSAFDVLKLRFSTGAFETPPPFVFYYVPIGWLPGIAPLPPSEGRIIENEFGLDASLSRRLQASISYTSRTRRGVITSDVVAPQATLVNLATKGSTVEATVQARVLQNVGGIDWDVGIVADRHRSRLEKYYGGCYFDIYSLVCEGSDFGSLRGQTFVRDKSKLPSSQAGFASMFDVNDEGYVVAVGAGNTWRDGKSRNLWGTNVVVNGVTYPWGIPIIQSDAEGSLFLQEVGDRNADFQFGFQNTLRFKSFRFYAHMDGQVGGDVVNDGKRQRYASGVHVDLDQSSKPDEQRKSMLYYARLGSGSASPEFIESATHIRLAEASLGYTFNSNRFAFLNRIGASAVQVDFIGRNLFTAASEYSGLNLQRAIVVSNGVELDYPPTRTFSLATKIVF